MKTKENKGITLIALAVTIIVMLILAGVTIATLTGENGIITNSRKAKIQNELSKYKEEVELYVANKYLENQGFNIETLTAGKNSLNYSGKEESEEGSIKTIIPDIADEYIEIMQIIKGKLLINTKDKTLIKVAQAVGIEVNPYDITEDGELLSSNGNLLLVDSEGTLALPDSVKTIGEGAFSGVEGLKTIIIPESVTEIGTNAFSNNQTLEKVIIKGNLLKIGDSAFDKAANLKEINLPDSINYIGQYAFANTGVTEIVIPKNVTILQQSTFMGAQLKNIVLQEGITKIGRYSLSFINLEQILIPSTITSIDSTAFSNCINLKTIDVSNNNNFVFENGMLLSGNRSQVVFITQDSINKSTTFTIPEGVINFNTNILRYTNIKKLIIAKSLESIDNSMMPSSIESIEIQQGNNNFYILQEGYLCNKNNELIICYSKEKDITTPNEIVTIGKYAFRQATEAQNINISNSVEKLSQYIFDGLKNLKNINIGKNVSDINVFVFPHIGCNVKVDSQNQTYVVENNILYKKQNGKKEILVSVLYNIEGTLQIDKEVKELGNYSFYEQNGLTDIVIPENVEKIGETFRACRGLKKVEIPKSVKSINGKAFLNTPILDEVIIYNKENSISGAPWRATKGMKVVTWSGK